MSGKPINNQPFLGKPTAGGGSGIPDPLTLNQLNVTTISGLSNINGSAYVPGGGGGNISQWSLCGAVSTINACNFDISGVKDLYVNGTAYIRQEIINQTTTVSENVITNYLTVSKNAFIHSNLTVSGLTTLSGLQVNNNLNVSGLTTLSGLTVNNNVTFSNLLTTSGLTVNNSALIGGLRVNNNALVAGTLTVSTNLVVSNLLTTSGLTVNRNATVSNLLTTSGLTVNNNATFSALITTERLQVNSNALVLNNLTVSGLVTLSGALSVSSNVVIRSNLSVSGLTTLSGLTVNNNALISNLLTTSGLTVSNNATVSNRLTTSGLTVNNNAQIISNLSVGTINGYVYPNTFFEGFGTNIIRVDVCGNDAIASIASNKYIYPFLTISAALSNASSGNEVFVSPGTYNQSSTLVIPAGVSLRGANTNGVFIQNMGATNSFTLVEMRSNTRIEDVTLNLSSSTTTICGAQYVVVAISGTDIPSIKLRTMVINANNSNKGGNVYGLYASGNADTDISRAVSSTTVRGTTINVNTSGQTGGDFLGSNARCIYSSGSNRVSIRDTNCFLIGTNCSSATLYGCETTASGSRMDLTTSIISARTLGTSNTLSVAEISQTHSNSVIELGATHLLGHSANGLGFSTIQLGTNFIYGVYQTGNWGNDFDIDGYMFPGTALRSAVEATSTIDAFPYTIPQDCILSRVLLRVNPNAVLGSSATMNVNIFINEDFANSIVTLSLTGTARVVSNFNFSRALVKDDRVYVNMSNVGTGVSELRSATVDFELY